MKKGFGLMVAMMGLAASSGIATTNTSDFNRSVNSAKQLASEGRTQNQDAKQTDQFSNQEKRTFNREKGSSLKSGWGSGISPKIYAMYHVKRGTHKRTNV